MICVGMLIYGYCEGYFGGDSYHTKRIEAFGVDWVVARELDEDSVPEFAYFDSQDEMIRCVTKWNREKSND